MRLCARSPTAGILVYRVARGLRVVTCLRPLGRITKLSVISIILQILDLSCAGGISYVQYRRPLKMHTSLRFGKFLYVVCLSLDPRLPYACSGLPIPPKVTIFVICRRNEC